MKLGQKGQKVQNIDVFGIRIMVQFMEPYCSKNSFRYLAPVLAGLLCSVVWTKPAQKRHFLLECTAGED